MKKQLAGGLIIALLGAWPLEAQAQPKEPLATGQPNELKGWAAPPAELGTPPGTPAAVNRATRLLGMTVRNPQNQKLGTIKDVVLDLENQTIGYVVLSSGGFLGLSEKLIAIPPQALTAGPDNLVLILNARKEDVKKARGLGYYWPKIDADWGAQPIPTGAGQRTVAPASQTD